MNRKQLDDELFDMVLKHAFEDELMAELESLPSQEELSKLYPPFTNMKNGYSRLLKISRIQTHKSAKKTVAIMAAVIVLSFGLCLFSPKVRASIKQAIYSVFDTHTRFSFHESNEIQVGLFTLGYAPRGYSIKDSFEMPEAGAYTYELSDGEDGIVILDYSLSPDGTISLDNDRHDLEQVFIGEYEGYVSDKGKNSGWTMLVWSDGKYQFSLQTTLSVQDTLKIAENIR